jgi:hypothetical protein
MNAEGHMVYQQPDGEGLLRVWNITPSKGWRIPLAGI